MRYLLATAWFALFVGIAAADPPAPKLPPPGEVPAKVIDMTPAELPGRESSHADYCREPEPAQFFISGEYLLMRPFRRNLNFALVDPLDDLMPMGRVAALNYRQDNGFRINAAYRLMGSAWEVGAGYTYFHASDRGQQVAPPGGLIYALPFRPGTVDVATSAAAEAGIDYDVYDLEFARSTRVDEHLSLRFGAGPRFAVISQNMAAFYNGLDADNAAAESSLKFHGAGLVVSGEAGWDLPWHFKLFARGRTSLIYGDFRSSVRESNFNGAAVYADLSDNYSQVVPVLEVGAGLAWEYRRIRAAVGYEAANWFHLADRPIFLDDFSEGKIAHQTGDLSLHAVFFRLGFAY